MNKIYVVNGLPESGKSEFGKQVGLVLRERDINFLHTSSIKYVKMLLQPETEWDEVLSSQPLITGLRSLKNKVTPLPDPRVGFVDAREPEYIREFQKHAIQTRLDIQVQIIFLTCQ